MNTKNKSLTKIVLICALIIFIPFLIFISTIIFEWSLNAIRHRGDTVVFASVNGDEIELSFYMALVQREMENYEKSNKEELTKEKIKDLKNQIFDYLVEQKIYEQNIKNNNIDISDKQIEYIMFKNPASLPENAKSIFFDSLGVFNKDLYMQAINYNSPENDEFKKSLKDAIKKQLEVKKLYEIITRDVKLTDDELKSLNNSKDIESMLEKKKNSEIQKWVSEMKSKAIIIDNRKEFEMEK